MIEAEISVLVLPFVSDERLCRISVGAELCGSGDLAVAVRALAVWVFRPLPSNPIDNLAGKVFFYVRVIYRLTFHRCKS